MGLFTDFQKPDPGRWEELFKESLKGKSPEDFPFTYGPVTLSPINSAQTLGDFYKGQGVKIPIYVSDNQNIEIIPSIDLYQLGPWVASDQFKEFLQERGITTLSVRITGPEVKQLAEKLKILKASGVPKLHFEIIYDRGLDLLGLTQDLKDLNFDRNRIKLMALDLVSFFISGGILDELKAWLENVQLFFSGAKLIFCDSESIIQMGIEPHKELAFLLGLEVLIAKLIEGGSLENQGIEFRINPGTNLFGGAAKLTLWKSLSARIAERIPELDKVIVSALGLSDFENGIFETENNILRQSSQITSGLICGYQKFYIHAYDFLKDQNPNNGLRTSLDLVALLDKEGRLGRVEDPLRGSYFFEELLSRLASESWKEFQEIEKAGGVGSPDFDSQSLLNEGLQNIGRQKQGFETVALSRVGENLFPKVEGSSLESVVVDEVEELLKYSNRVNVELNQLRFNNLKRRPIGIIKLEDNPASNSSLVSLQNKLASIGFANRALEPIEEGRNFSCIILLPGTVKEDFPNFSAPLLFYGESGEIPKELENEVTSLLSPRVANLLEFGMEIEKLLGK